HDTKAPPLISPPAVGCAASPPPAAGVGAAGTYPRLAPREARTPWPPPRRTPHGLFQVLHRPPDLRGGAVDRDLRRRPDLDPAAANRRIPRSRAAVGGGAHGLSRRQSKGHRRDRV